MPGDLNDTSLLLRNLMDNLSDAIYFKDRQSRFMMMNQACCTRHGWESTEAVRGRSDFDVFSKEHAEQAFADEQKIIETGEPLDGIEEKETWPDGSSTWVSTTKMPLRNEEGEVIGTFGISRDITKHKEAELRAAYYAEQVRSIKERKEEDVRMAGELQKTFFPRKYPVFPAGVSSEDSRVQFLHYYHASGMVSGDFCAVMQLSDTESAIFQCDVMGHGVRAALGTALIWAVVEELSQQERNPGNFLARMNELLLPILRQDDVFLYATACYTIFDASTGMLRSANAGHPDPLHFQGSENRAVWLMDDDSLRGPALAIVEQAEYPTFEKQMMPGDSIVMYTDGLYEAIGPNDEEFGEVRLLGAACHHASLPLAELFPALINDVRQFSLSGEFDDDICLVGFTFRNPM